GTYVRRVEGRFDHIERKGSNPTDFFWEVIDKSGTKFTYGANANANSRLYDARSGKKANIFRWALERVEDAFGNYMTITYTHDPFSVGQDSTRQETFDQLYPLRIDYTGGPSLAPAYSVTFTLDDGSTRADRIITGRPGFPVATRRRLSQIDVALGTTP